MTSREKEDATNDRKEKFWEVEEKSLKELLICPPHMNKEKNCTKCIFLH